jgi:cell division protein FtsN
MVSGASYWFYAHKIRPAMAENKSLGGLMAAAKSLFHHQVVVAPKPINKAEAAKPEPEVHFDFYNQLPNMQVRVAAPQSSAVIPSAPGYVLQLALFSNLNEASEARISYLLSGADVNVVKVGNSYRVQQGPYASLTTAKSIQKKLHRKGIETVLKKTLT